MRPVHFLTIGEAPRPDVTPEVLGFLGSAAEAVVPVERGALDGLSRAEVAAGGPRNGEMPLVSRLTSGEEVILGEGFLEERIKALVDEVPAGALAAILCTGPFTGVRERPWLVKAGAAFDAALAAACPAGATVGMLIPEPRQEDDARRRVPAGAPVVVASFSPYAEVHGVMEVADAFRDADVIGLNCLGYTGALAREVEGATGKPVVLAREELARELARRIHALCEGGREDPLAATGGFDRPSA